MKRIIPCLAFLFLLGCSHPTSKDEKNILPKDKMIHILLDMHLTEANSDPVKLKKDEKEMEKLATEYEKIFKKNGVTSAEFYSTFNYYLSHPAQMDSAYKDLVTEATRRQSQVYHNLPNGTRTDSIQRH